MRINIAIDGPSAAGKSTISKKLASKLGYRYLDTGAMYRCVALKAKRENIELNDEEKIMGMLSHTIIYFDTNQNVYLDDEDVSVAIRENDISFMASTVSLLLGVRKDMVLRQQEIARLQPGIIMDGRDIGSVVLKDDAHLKIFLDASVEVRSKRRFEELQKKGEQCSYDEIYQDILKRDYQDTHRTNSPLIKCDDAVEVDTSDLSIDGVVEKILELAYQRGA